MQKNTNQIPKIRVIVRKRPLSKKQITRGQKDIIEIRGYKSVIVKQQKVKLDLTPYTDEYQFNFDAAFNQITTNQQIYVSTVRPLIDAAFDGARVSCFAYGQTGSGKTYTMLGDGNQVQGLYILAGKDVFGLINKFEGMSIWISFYEIYCGKLYDLLNQRNILYARQDAKSNINIVGLSQRKIQNISQLINTIQYGTSIRVTSQNSTNADSSRSHAILQITLKKGKKLQGKISFIDLAGSQRAADHADQTDKQTRIDGAQINKSLLALKQCIRALDQNKQHTPFRGSKLTMVLKDSFTGYCKTVMIGNISPNDSSCQNTLNTLKYADRVKQLKKPTNIQLMPNDYLNDLSRQLMLPRQLVNHQHVNHNIQIESDEPKRSQSQMIKMKNNFISQSNSKKINIFKNSEPKNKGEVTVFERNSSVFVPNNNGSIINGQNIYNNSKPKRHTQYTNPKNNNQSSKSQNYSNKLSFQQNHQSKKQDQDRLNQRHEQLLLKVIEDEQILLQQHTSYINFSVQSTKQHIHLMNDANQVGSSIQNYLNKLQTNLQNQVDQIYKLKARIQNLKYTLDQSKKVQKLYLSINQSNQMSSQTNNINRNSFFTPSKGYNYHSQYHNEDVNIDNTNYEQENLLFQ